MKIERMNDLINNKSLGNKNIAKDLERISYKEQKNEDLREQKLYHRHTDDIVNDRTTDPALLFQYKGDKELVNEFLDWIYTVIQNLSERERICWWERVVNGKTYKAISEEHGYFVKSVPKATKRANGFIRDMLKHCPLDLKEVQDALRGV